MKKDRHKRILELITEYDIKTQDKLIEKLREDGYNVTQATISRDIREMKLTKGITPGGRYAYMMPPTDSSPINDFTLSGALINAIVYVKSALNQVVIKTTPGLAQAVAVMIDANKGESILGCVAGDDTIIVVTDRATTAELLTSQINSMSENMK